MIPLNSNFPPLSDENAPLHALKLAVVSEIRRISVKVSGVETFVGDRLAITWLPRRTETYTIAKEHTFV